MGNPATKNTKISQNDLAKLIQKCKEMLEQGIEPVSQNRVKSGSRIYFKRR